MTNTIFQLELPVTNKTHFIVKTLNGLNVYPKTITPV